MTRPKKTSMAIVASSANTPRTKLELAYQRMSSLTGPRCGQACGRPGFCCKPQFCEATARYAREVYEIQLTRTKHPELPFMGEHGCTVPPYLRPACTIYVCEGHFEDKTFQENYQWLRDSIDKLEEEANGVDVDDPWPPGTASELLTSKMNGLLSGSAHDPAKNEWHASLVGPKGPARSTRAHKPSSEEDTIDTLSGEAALSRVS